MSKRSQTQKSLHCIEAAKVKEGRFFKVMKMFYIVFGTQLYMYLSKLIILYSLILVNFVVYEFDHIKLISKMNDDSYEKHRAS